jgi:hypothetical protein
MAGMTPAFVTPANAGVLCLETEIPGQARNDKGQTNPEWQETG